MPKATGFTARGKIEKYLRETPGFYHSRKLANLFKVSQSTAASVLSELNANYPRYVQRLLNGRSTHYYVDFGKGPSRANKEQAAEDPSSSSESR